MIIQSCYNHTECRMTPKYTHIKFKQNGPNLTKLLSLFNQGLERNAIRPPSTF